MIKIVAIQPVEGIMCAIPDRGSPISMLLIHGNVTPGCYIEIINDWEHQVAVTWEVVTKNVKPPKGECPV